MGKVGGLVCLATTFSFVLAFISLIVLSLLDKESLEVVACLLSGPGS